jgi:hypothetical protein
MLARLFPVLLALFLPHITQAVGQDSNYPKLEKSPLTNSKPGKIEKPKPPKPIRMPKEWYDPKSLAKRVSYSTDLLKQTVAVEQIKTQCTHTNLIGFTAVLRNRTAHDVSVMAQTTFKDKGGKKLLDDSGLEPEWTTLHIPANGAATYEASTNSEKAFRFNILLKPLTKPRF